MLKTVTALITFLAVVFLTVPQFCCCVTELMASAIEAATSEVSISAANDAAATVAAPSKAADEETAHSCCHQHKAKSYKAPAYRIISGSYKLASSLLLSNSVENQHLQFKNECNCQAHQNIVACTSLAGKLSSDIEAPCLTTLNHLIESAGIADSADGVPYKTKRGPPRDFESIRASKTYLFNQVFRC